MALAKDYQSVMGRSNEIQKRAPFGLDYADFETSPISFDYDAFDEIHRIYVRRNRKNSRTARCRQHTALELRNITKLARKYAKPGFGARIFAKDESCNASGSFKDRRAACAVAHAKKLGYKGVMA